MFPFKAKKQKKRRSASRVSKRYSLTIAFPRPEIVTIPIVLVKLHEVPPPPRRRFFLHETIRSYGDETGPRDLVIRSTEITDRFVAAQQKWIRDKLLNRQQQKP